MTLTEYLIEEKLIDLHNDDHFDELVHNIFTFSLAGQDTTSGLTQMFFYYMAQNPDISEKVAAEVDFLFPRKSDISDSISYEQLNQTNYLDACINETLRHFGPTVALFNRVAQVDHQLGDLHIKKGSVCNALFMANHYCEQYFKQPFEFRPQRWLNQEERKNAYQPFVFVPFSGGTRNCIGQHLARIEAKIIIISFYQLYQTPKIPDSYQLTLAIKSSYEPETPVPFLIELREDN